MQIKLTIAVFVVLSLCFGCQPKNTRDSEPHDKPGPTYKDLLSKISRQELEKLDSFAIGYYKFRLHQTSIWTNRVVWKLGSYLAETYETPFVSHGWWMAIVTGHPTIGDVKILPNQWIGTMKENKAIIADIFVVTIVDEQVGYILDNRFVPRTMKRFDKVFIIKTSFGYQIDFDTDLNSYGTLEGDQQPNLNCSNLIVEENDLPEFLETISTWYRKISSNDIVYPDEAYKRDRWQGN